MVRLKCSTCNFEYDELHNLCPCPKCGGIGRTNPNCTCISRGNFIGVMKIMVDKNHNCPVHGKNANVKK